MRRRLALLALFSMLPVFQVVPADLVEQTIADEGIRLDSPADVRRLAKVLGVDAVVPGTVTDFTPYYPPRCGLRVEWYAANPGFHPIPPGYGLAWGTPEEEHIPDRFVLEAELALVSEQLKRQTPLCGATGSYPEAGPEAALPLSSGYTEQSGCNHTPVGTTSTDVTVGTTAMIFPPDWPDARGFIPPPPSPYPPPCWPNEAPVLKHTRTYSGVAAVPCPITSNDAWDLKPPHRPRHPSARNGFADCS